jgi:uncharacterized membrane protein YedE/YeeE
MSVLQGILIGLATGIVFGFALEKSRVFEPGVIIGQMQLRSFLMLKIFLSAVIAGLLVMAVLHGVLGVKLHLKPLLLRADLIGGLILGAGIAIAGACPGTALAQIGAGYRDALFTVAGGIAGAIAYGYLDQPLTAQLADAGQKVSFDKIAGLPFWMAALMLAAALTLLLVVVERSSPWRGETGDYVDGLRNSCGRTGHAVDTVTQVNAG